MTDLTLAKASLTVKMVVRPMPILVFLLVWLNVINVTAVRQDVLMKPALKMPSVSMRLVPGATVILMPAKSVINTFAKLRIAPIAKP